MSWMRQVAHVARKDLQYTKWLLIIYAAGLAYMVYQSVEPFERGNILPIFLMPVLLAAIVVTLVHGDSPSRPDAFWATRPLSPLAVATAKVVALALGVGIPAMLGQWIVLTRFAMEGADLFRGLGVSALALVIQIGFFFALAALTRTTGEFVIALIVLLVVSQLAGAWQFTSGARQSPAAPWIVASVAQLTFPVLALLAIVTIYRSRRLALGRRLGTGAFVFMLVGSYVSDTALPPWAAAPSTIVARAHQYMAGDSLRIDVKLPVPKDSTLRYSPVLTRVEIGARRARTRRDYGNSVPRFNLGEPVSWLGAQLRFDTLMAAAFVPGVNPNEVVPRDIKIAGYFETEQQKVVGTIPLVAGQIIRVPGLELKIVDVDPATARIEFKVLNIYRSTRRPTDPKLVEYVLLNRFRHEAVHLKLAQGYSNPLPLPIPGLGTTNGGETFELMKFGRLPIDADWLREAELVVVAWRPAGRVPFTATVPTSMVTGHGTLPR